LILVLSISVENLIIDVASSQSTPDY